MFPQLALLSPNLCSLGYDVLPGTLTESRNCMKERSAGLVGEFTKLSAGKVEEKGGDVASLVATLPSNHF